MLNNEDSSSNIQVLQEQLNGLKSQRDDLDAKIVDAEQTLKVALAENNVTNFVFDVLGYEDVIGVFAGLDADHVSALSAVFVSKLDDLLADADRVLHPDDHTDDFELSDVYQNDDSTLPSESPEASANERLLVPQDDYNAIDVNASYGTVDVPVESDKDSDTKFGFKNVDYDDDDDGSETSDSKVDDNVNPFKAMLDTNSGSKKLHDVAKKDHADIKKDPPDISSQTSEDVSKRVAGLNERPAFPFFGWSNRDRAPTPAGK